MITLHGEEVKVGDKVWDIHRGWGEVIQLYNENDNYPICVLFEGFWEKYTKEGGLFIESRVPSLFWQPIEIEIPKKPKQKEKAWQWVCRDNDGKYWITYMHCTEGKEVLEYFGAVPIEPYLPSEIEREVKE